MDWQQMVSLVIVAFAAGALAWTRIRRRKFSMGHDAHCGCSTVAGTTVAHSIVFRARKGERPQILLKMK